MSTHILTGASSGIGRALADRLRDRGDRLVLLLRNADRIEQLRSDFPGAVFAEADLARPATLRGLGRIVPGPVDSLLHVAGTLHLGLMAELDRIAWQRTLDVNLTAPAVLTHEFLPQLREARGTVVFVNSTAGLATQGGWSAYSASKFGLRALADALREEEAAHGIRVTSVYPGRVATPMQAKVHEFEGRDYDPDVGMTVGTVADSILNVLDLPTDAGLPELVLRPR
jgi:NAD(P)-dependent dehydrogenase (short-subunit alcohol dehydrogenase family)